MEAQGEMLHGLRPYVSTAKTVSGRLYPPSYCAAFLHALLAVQPAPPEGVTRDQALYKACGFSQPLLSALKSGYQAFTLDHLLALRPFAPPVSDDALTAWLSADMTVREKWRHEVEETRRASLRKAAARRHAPEEKKKIGEELATLRPPPRLRR